MSLVYSVVISLSLRCHYLSTIILIANHDYHHIDAPQTPERRRLDAPCSPYVELACKWESKLVGQQK